MTAHATPQSAVLFGAGLTGLTTAFYLSRQGYRVTLLDHPSWQDGFQCNNSHPAPAVFGRHRETWRLLHLLNKTAVPTVTLPLEFYVPDRHVVAYRSAHLPGPLQWMMSLFTFHGLAWHDRWKLFSHVEQIWEQAQSLPRDLEGQIADEWLASTGQSEKARRNIWHPLGQWLTGNALTRLSAATFVQLLSTLFLGQATDARLTPMQGSVEDRFTTPLRQALPSRNTTISTLTELPHILFTPQGIRGVQMPDGTMLQAGHYIAALSPESLLALLPERLLTRYAYFAQLGDLRTLSSVTVHMDCRTTAVTPRVILLAGQPFESLMLRPLGAHEVDYNLTISGSQTQSSSMDDELSHLARTTLQTLGNVFAVDQILSVTVRRDKHAALSLPPGANLLRPIQQSPLPNFTVAGAWTDTGWPANVESALTSARRCAETITKMAP